MGGNSDDQHWPSAISTFCEALFAVSLALRWIWYMLNTALWKQYFCLYGSFFAERFTAKDSRASVNHQTTSIFHTFKDNWYSAQPRDVATVNVTWGWCAHFPCWITAASTGPDAKQPLNVRRYHKFRTKIRLKCPLNVVYSSNGFYILFAQQLPVNACVNTVIMMYWNSSRCGYDCRNNDENTGWSQL